MFPEEAAGGFNRLDGTIEFYSRVNALINPSDVVLDVGAGRGAGLNDDQSAYRRELRRIQGKCAKVIGIDVDTAIHDHPALDERYVVSLEDGWPIADQSIDKILCDFVLEHIGDPKHFAAEVDRVLRPSGWLCARTPNCYNYVAIAARMTPSRFEKIIMKRAQPDRRHDDIFEKHYLLNTPRAVRRFFPADQYLHASYCPATPPAYFGRNKILARFMLHAERLSPSWLRHNMFVFLQKRKNNGRI